MKLKIERDTTYAGTAYHQTLYRLPFLGYRDVAWFLGNNLNRYGRGEGLVALGKNLLFFGIVLAAAFKVWLGTSVFLSGVLALIAVIVIAVLNLVIGTLDELKGFWKVQNIIATDKLNPFFSEMNSKIVKIYKAIEEGQNGR